MKCISLSGCSKDISENNYFNFFHLHLVCWNPVEEFLLESSEEAFHPGVIKAAVNATEALQNTCIIEFFTECFTCILASAI